MRMGDLTERAGVTPRTIRYYESIGLLPPGEREGNGPIIIPRKPWRGSARLTSLKSSASAWKKSVM